MLEKEKCNQYWSYGGKGFASFGTGERLSVEVLPSVKEDWVLVKVDAYTIRASDVKMVDMGNDYPLFKDCDFDKHPARLGKELSLIVIETGDKLKKRIVVGKRFGVQPDVGIDDNVLI